MVDDQFHSFSSLKWQFQIHLGIIFPVVPHVILELSPQSPPSALRALPGGESGKGTGNFTTLAPTGGAGDGETLRSWQF